MAQKYAFGEILNGEMILNKAGKIVLAELLELPKRLKPCRINLFTTPCGISMQQIAKSTSRAQNLLHWGQSLDNSNQGQPQPLEDPKSARHPIWQRNYYEHVIRDETDLKIKRLYQKQNPSLERR